MSSKAPPKKEKDDDPDAQGPSKGLDVEDIKLLKSYVSGRRACVK
jgi:hypothetical protein